MPLILAEEKLLFFAIEIAVAEHFVHFILLRDGLMLLLGLLHYH